MPREMVFGLHLIFMGLDICDNKYKGEDINGREQRFPNRTG
jgi:hypothetical protein